MTSLEKIESYLRQNAGRAYCDDCLSQRLEIHPRQQVQQKTSRLSQDGRFWRQRGPCDGHRRDDKVVIRLRVSPS